MAVHLTNAAADLVVTLNPGAPLLQPGMRLESGPWPNPPELRFGDGTRVTIPLSEDKIYADVNIPIATVTKLVAAWKAENGMAVSLVDSITGYPYANGRVHLGDEVPA